MEARARVHSSVFRKRCSGSVVSNLEDGVKRSQNFIWIGWDAFRLATACGDYGSTRVVRLGFHLMLIQQVTLDYVVVKGNLLHCIATLQRAGKSLKN